jgi:hypothetical protein
MNTLHERTERELNDGHQHILKHTEVVFHILSLCFGLDLHKHTHKHGNVIFILFYHEFFVIFKSSLTRILVTNEVRPEFPFT